MRKNPIPATKIGWLGDKVDSLPASGQVKESNTPSRTAFRLDRRPITWCVVDCVGCGLGTLLTGRGSRPPTPLAHQGDKNTGHPPFHSESPLFLGNDRELLHPMVADGGH